jgi:hemerythrin-like domain-containing protein
MGPFDILAEQHRELEERLAALGTDEGASGPEPQRERAQALAARLRLHMRVEERHLLPLQARVEGRARAHEQHENHLTMRELVDELEELTPGQDEWWARFTTLEDLVVAHVHEQESETFPRLLTALDENEQEQLRQALAAAEARDREERDDEMLNTLSPHGSPGPLVDAPRWDV